MAKESYAYDNLIGGHNPHLVPGSGSLAAGLDLERGQVLAKRLWGVVSSAAGANTGDGTIGTLTIGTDYEGGAYDVTCEEVDDNMSITSSDMDLGNTGDGTIAAPSVQASVQEGDYVLTCEEVTLTYAVASTGADDGAGGAMAGDGAITLAASGTAARAGAYEARCVDTTAGGGLAFEVVTPDGDLLEPAAGLSPINYANNHIEFRITEGAAPFALADRFFINVAETRSGGRFRVIDPSGARLADALEGVTYLTDQVGFEITAGATAFAVGDFGTIVIDNDPSGGRFSVVSPSGVRLADATVGAAYVSDHVGFLITDGATLAFVLGDSFTVTAAAGDARYIKADSTLVNGAQHIEAILAADCDASLGNAACEVYLSGVFNEEGCTFEGADDADTFRTAARRLGIHFRTNQPA